MCTRPSCLLMRLCRCLVAGGKLAAAHVHRPSWSAAPLSQQLCSPRTVLARRQGRYYRETTTRAGKTLVGPVAPFLTGGLQVP